MAKFKHFQVMNPADDIERFDVIISFTNAADTDPIRWKITAQYTDKNRNHREPLGNTEGTAPNPLRFPAEEMASDIKRAMFAALAGEEEPRDAMQRAGWLIRLQDTQRAPRWAWAFAWLDFSAPRQLGKFADQFRDFFALPFRGIDADGPQPDAPTQARTPGSPAPTQNKKADLSKTI